MSRFQRHNWVPRRKQDKAKTLDDIRREAEADAARNAGYLNLFLNSIWVYGFMQYLRFSYERALSEKFVYIPSVSVFSVHLVWNLIWFGLVIYEVNKRSDYWF